ncbi:LANO_0E15016g1_1 [Lachancea nothofagi CBS 11611]|uniref:Non-structural maintenance of chromosomes element 1 homolog n=1 Tax=Lachancea nothofagi CBS 11611 TaxID=1266666 RepID=A0A1G4K0H6_9SACH|nr:LANO_0E15016g1_1 [Lachancea nothofagi CBS 11611]
MEESLTIGSQLDNVLSEDTRDKLLLQYLLLHRGSCEGTQLVKALEALDPTTLSHNDSSQMLKSWVTRINLALNVIDFKIVRQMGRLGEWNYVYVDLAPADDTKSATSLKPDDLTFVQWAIQRCLEDDKSAQEVNAVKSNVETAVDNVLSEKFSTSEFDGLKLKVDYTCGSTELCQYEELNALEVEGLLVHLCQLRWFYMTDQGRIGLDVRALAELQEYIQARFEVPVCVVCHEIALQGAKCQCGESAWHVSCFRHFVTHVGSSCAHCGEKVQQAVYMS